MVEDTAAIPTNKFLSKHRWRAKFRNDDEPALTKEQKQARKVEAAADVSDFLKPSTERANRHHEIAASAFLAGAKPRIDVAAAQRWPGANDIGAGGRTPGSGGMRTGTKKKGLVVSFVRTQPEVIGEGGDECEEPSIEVFKRRTTNRLSDVDKLQGQSHKDDLNVGMRSPHFNALESVNKEAERRGIVTRNNTSHGELSPPLRQKLEIGNINTHTASTPPAPPERLGTMGLGEFRRPKPLSRAPTGFDIDDDAPSRPSMDSSFSFDSESKKAPSLAATMEEDEDGDFNPKPLSRSQTGWSEHTASPDDDRAPRLPEMKLGGDVSPLESAMDRPFLESEPTDPNSFSAKLMHRMKSEEGKALHEAARLAALEDSDSSTASYPPPGPFHGTPPTTYIAPLAGRSSSRGPARDPAPSFPPREPPRSPHSLDTEDPMRSRARGPSPARRIPPGGFPLDTDARPASSASSHHTIPSATLKTRGSPVRQVDPYATAISNSVQRTSSTREGESYSAASSTSILPTLPPFEKAGYMDPYQARPPVAPQHSESRMPQASAPRNNAPAQLARSDTKAQGEFAFREFSDRVTHMKSIFRLTAEMAGQMHDHTPMQWLRVAIWWFLKGRAGMEAFIRGRPKTQEAQPERLTQAHVDLAKTWWIITEVFPNHPSLRRYGDQRIETQAKTARDAGDVPTAEMYEAHDTILASVKLLMGSMKKHSSMPPTQALIQGQDQGIWEEYPRFAPDAQSVLSGDARHVFVKGAEEHVNPATAIPVTDTMAEFCYSRMFVSASLSTDDPNTDRIPLPVVISVLRPRDDYKVKLSICSQSSLINIVVGNNPQVGPTWRDVAWKSRGISVQLRHGFVINMELSELDFKQLWSIVDHTTRVESQLHERQDERLIFKMTLRNFSYRDPTNPNAFAPERIPGCKLVVFEKFERSSEGTGKRRLHRGYRATVVTGTKSRTLSCINHELGTKQEPMNFEYVNDPADNAPALNLRLKEETKDKKTKVCTMLLVFHDTKERNNVFGTFTSMNIGPEEDVFASVPLKALTIESADQAEGFTQKDALKKLQWQEIKVMNQDPIAAGMEQPPTIKSESLRLVARHGAGVMTDRMNLETGELLVRLPVGGAAELTLLRNAQHDMAVAVDAARTDKEVPEALAELLKTLTTMSTFRTFTFNTFKDLHDFQLAVTGCEVKFDGIASTFSISRRRMVVPIYKQWMASNIRIQIVQQDNVTQLLAFFEEFSHADAMNFQLKSMDIFEKTDKGGKPGLRLVDAKFALPVEERRGEGKMGKAEGRLTGWAGVKRRFVCLDQIEYPGEHDDINIGFADAATRNKFADALPAATMERKFTVRRKI
ncbi:hypothetical protein P154DRAFT_463256 [Amniculicola lignicola CBS 123094]|uniref:Uncharacterized protein n=1 Tax=Amniculicola lignicola CBS 123094 TaxID=1392246 RepID=A0A6A5WPS5_9PLEO|nr:hypothetical protein P154DRAFT_463256 [Amniculicola lignicola CBS 123094]